MYHIRSPSSFRVSRFKGREVKVVLWAGDAITLAEDIESDGTWTGLYAIKTSFSQETEWVDNAPLPGRAFYRVRRN